MKKKENDQGKKQDKPSDLQSRCQCKRKPRTLLPIPPAHEMLAAFASPRFVKSQCHAGHEDPMQSSSSPASPACHQQSQGPVMDAFLAQCVPSVWTTAATTRESGSLMCHSPIAAFHEKSSETRLVT
ncbi:hypothetical protein LIA77_06402 [Sarocladium implicatum]|nr:hypothetical protein LIA77_06402 [Sarocladium implicatum]